MAGLNTEDSRRTRDIWVEELANVVGDQSTLDFPKRDVKQMVAMEDVSALADLMREGNWQERVDAVRGLGLVGDARVIEPLIRGLMDEDRRVRTESARTLAIIGRRMQGVIFAR